MTPFFVVGCDRSGTTLLRLVLERGGQVAIPTESMIVADFSRRRERYGRLDDDASFARLAADVWQHPKVREWRLASSPPAREGRVGDAAYRAALEAPFLAYAREHGRPRWGDKTPYYVNELDEVKRVFPEARILNLVRDGRDVAMSLARVPFGPGNVWGAAHMWRNAVRAGERAHERYGDDVLTIRYEDLATEPEPTVRAVCGFLELAYNPAMLAVERSPARVASGQEAWFRGLAAAINPGSVGRWRREMRRRDRALFAAIAGDELRRHGYELPDAGPPPPVPDAVYRAQNWAVKLRQFVALHVVAERGREVPYIVRRHVGGRRRAAQPAAPSSRPPAR